MLHFFKFNNNDRRKAALQSYVLAFNQDYFSGSILLYDTFYFSNFPNFSSCATKLFSKIIFFLEQGQDCLLWSKFQPLTPDNL